MGPRGEKQLGLLWGGALGSLSVAGVVEAELERGLGCDNDRRPTCLPYVVGGTIQSAARVTARSQRGGCGRSVWSGLKLEKGGGRKKGGDPGVGGRKGWRLLQPSSQPTVWEED